MCEREREREREKSVCVLYVSLCVVRMSLACVCGSHASTSTLQLIASSPAKMVVLVHHPMYVPVLLNGQDPLVQQVRLFECVCYTVVKLVLMFMLQPSAPLNVRMVAPVHPLVCVPVLLDGLDRVALIVSLRTCGCPQYTLTIAGYMCGHVIVCTYTLQLFVVVLV